MKDLLIELIDMAQWKIDFYIQKSIKLKIIGLDNLSLNFSNKVTKYARIKKYLETRLLKY